MSCTGRNKVQAGQQATPPARVGDIEGRILLVRGHRIMLDSDLAALYQVPTKALNQAVRRNLERFPPDFMFRLTSAETTTLRLWLVSQKGTDASRLRSQFVTSNGRGGRRYLPQAFTEQGVAMLSSVLRSKRAVMVNVEIMRTFVRLRAILAAHRDLAQRLDELERKYDGKFAAVFEAIRDLMTPPVEEPAGRIGFRARDKQSNSAD